MESTTVDVTFLGTGGAFSAGRRSNLALLIEATEGSKTLTVRLLAGEEQIDVAEVEAETDPCPVFVERRGTYFVVKVDDKLVFSVQR